MIDDNTVIHVGDVIATPFGDHEIGTLTVCLQPSTDPKGEDETKAIEVEACEYALPFVVDLIFAPPRWVYKSQITAIVRRFDERDTPDGA